MNYQLAQNASECKNIHSVVERTSTQDNKNKEKDTTLRIFSLRSVRSRVPCLKCMCTGLFRLPLCYGIRSTRRVSQLPQTAFVAGVRVCVFWRTRRSGFTNYKCYKHISIYYVRCTEVALQESALLP